MRSVLICEGNTDLTLIQYFLEKAYGWEYISEGRCRDLELTPIHDAKGFKWLINKTNNKFLCLIEAGGSTKILNQLEGILNFNSFQTEREKFFEKIIILTDNDDDTTENEMLGKFSTLLNDKQFINENIYNNEWNIVNFELMGEIIASEFLPLIIPFESTGAMEDFLLEALKKNSIESDPDQVISHIVDESRGFVDNLNCSGKYLIKRREKTKAKFTTVFAILTPAEAFKQRKNLLQSVPWEEYRHVQLAFEKLSSI